MTTNPQPKSAAERYDEMCIEMTRPRFAYDQASSIPMDFLSKSLMMAVAQGIISGEQSGAIHNMVRADLETPLGF